MRNHVFSLLLSVLFCTFAFGQPLDLTGIVTDTKGAVVANADVKLLTSQQIVLAATKTDAQGRYSFEDVADGSYVVVASRPDFSARSLAVNLGAVRPVNLDLQLSINQLSEEVT